MTWHAGEKKYGLGITLLSEQPERVLILTLILYMKFLINKNSTLLLSIVYKLFSSRVIYLKIG